MGLRPCDLLHRSVRPRASSASLCPRSQQGAVTTWKIRSRTTKPPPSLFPSPPCSCSFARRHQRRKRNRFRLQQPNPRATRHRSRCHREPRARTQVRPLRPSRARAIARCSSCARSCSAQQHSARCSGATCTRLAREPRRPKCLRIDGRMKGRAAEPCSSWSDVTATNARSESRCC